MGVMCDFMALFFMKCSDFYIKNNMKNFQNINYPLV